MRVAALIMGMLVASVPPRVLFPAGLAMVPPSKAQLEVFLKDLRRESENLRTL